MMKLHRKDVLCPFIENDNIKNKEIECCDELAWKTRRLYPKNFNCAKDNKCIGRYKELRQKRYECQYRDVCTIGDNCKSNGKNGKCVFCEICRDLICWC